MRTHLLNLFVFIAVLLATVSITNAQVSISTDNSNPDTSAILDLKSDTRGFLPPRMTYAQLNAISNPASGLIVYCADCGLNGLGALYLFMAGAWYTLSANCTVPSISPVAGTHVPSPTQIIWTWNCVPGASGYKWNTVNDSTTATNMGISTTKTETGLLANTAYTRYVWAYNPCGISQTTTLTSQTIPFSIGLTYGGGIIFYIDGTGQHGLISATSDQGNAGWGCYGTFIGGTSTDFGTGQANTNAIVAGCSEAGIAARICNDLILNEYEDWFLPSQSELHEMCLKKGFIGGFSSWDANWSSSEINATNTWYKYMSNCFPQNYLVKYTIYCVRCIRSF